MTRGRLAGIAVGSAAASAVLLALAGALVLRSDWFRGQVRRKLVDTVATATGGRVEVGTVAFDWRRLRASAESLTIHGTEPPDRPPLFHAASATLELKIVSVFKRKVDLAALDVSEPHVYLMVYPDGRTNLPAPKVPANGSRPPVETVLDMAIGRFSLQNGIFEVERRGKTPFDVRGRSLELNLGYERAGRRYRGSLAVQPLDVNVAGYAPTAVGIAANLTIDKDRILIDSAALRTGASQLRISGAVENLAAPRVSLDYDVRASQADVARVLETKLLESGTAQVTGHAVWAGAGNFSATGVLHAVNLEYRDAYVWLRNFRGEGLVSAGPAGIDVTDLRLSGFYAPHEVSPGSLPDGRGSASGTGSLPHGRSSESGTEPRRSGSVPNSIPADIRIERAVVRGADIHFTGFNLAALGGTFQGGILLESLDRFHVNGEIAGFEARRVVSVYSPAPLPWDARASGPLTLEGSFSKKGDLRISTSLAIAPEPGGAPVHGQVAARYDAASGILDLGRSTLTLPASRVDFSGALGRELRVHLETHDLNDLLPALGESAASFPLKLENGGALFDGSVVGSMDDPRIAGRIGLTRFSYAGKGFDSLVGDAAASSGNVRLDNATLAIGAIRAQFQAAVALDEWNAGPDSEIFGNAAIRNAPLTEVASLVEWQGAAATGSLSVTAQATGTVSNPLLQADMEVSKGGVEGEPFDRAAAHATYTTRSLEISSGVIAAGAKQAQFSAIYSHGPGDFTAGHWKLQASSNAMPLDQIRTLAEARPGIAGTVQATVAGDVDIRPARPGQRGFAVTGLQADIAAEGLRLGGQTFGNMRLTAASEGGMLRAHLDSDFAGSTVHGDGSWKLEGDYPGSAAIAFSRLDFVRVRDWVAPSKSGAAPFAGSAEGELRIDAALFQPESLKAELRISKFELGPAPGAAPAKPGQPLTLHNNGPIVATLANGAVTIESAHLEGRDTDVTVAGKATLQSGNPLDLRVNGRMDLGVLQVFYPSLGSAGSLIVTATVRGALDSPQIGGRMEIRDASLSLADFPNGLSHANGIVLFAGNRATIQSLSGETGGGKLDLTGFAGMAGDQTVFQLHANAKEVRVRYPAGVSTVVDASLNLTGTTERSMLAGSITVLRTGFNPESDFSSVLASSAAPFQTPSASGGPLAGLNFDILVQTSPDVQVESSLTQDVGMEANLRLKGTVSNPGVQGRVNITQGQLLFFGTRYAINQGSVAFYNQSKIEPVIDVDLETKAKGIDVTLNVSGTPGKLNLTPRSDPPLQFSEIVAFLATGAAPTTDPTLLTESSTAPQSWQQMGASALLGQAIASPVTGRLQRFFGVSRLRIDPTLPGVENNPQARVTLEQQVTPAITFTYITVVSNSNPQVIGIEWDLGKQWSVSALREENGVFGIDFYVKRRLK
jgi:translocation and assembly module TamB